MDIKWALKIFGFGAFSSDKCSTALNPIILDFYFLRGKASYNVFLQFSGFLGVFEKKLVFI